jgi:hypothetical protein
VDSREARGILTFYRPGSTDAADPRMAEALDQARRDPELAVWFEQHCAVYNAVRSKLKGIQVPPGLKRQIIIDQAQHPRVVTLPAAVKLLLAAAAIVILSVAAWFMFNQPGSEIRFASYRDRMARSVQRSNVPYMKYASTNQVDILAYFRANNRPADFDLPNALKQLPGEGGSALTWNNHPVEMLCLDATVPGGPSNNLWVFVMNKDAVPDAPAAGPQFAQIAKLMTASWSTGDKIYLVAAAGTEQDVRKYLQ